MADRYISEKALIENIAKIEDLRTLSTKTIGEAISKTPTADVVEVVRCKDCRFNVANMKKDEYDTTDYSGEDIVCSYFMTDGMLPNDFCSYGERRTENESRVDVSRKSKVEKREK